MTPIVMLLALVATPSSDAAYVVLIPLAGVIYASVGRHPIAGIAAAFAGVSGGFSANFMPGPIDALILGVTEPAVHILDPSWTVNVAGNWYFILGMAIVFFRSAGSSPTRSSSRAWETMSPPPPPRWRARRPTAS
jgi:aminobenzoyl-glutamate transport protein